MPTARLFKGSLLLWAPLILQSSLAEAQDHARCTNSSFAWSFNSRNQDPCQIGEALGRVCSSSWIIPPLPQDYYYSGMGKAFASPCLCNTVYYTLTSVCGLCQGGYAERFDLWSENCTSTTTTYPRPIPSTVNVPNYAFLPLDRVNQTVDLSRLRADNGPESVGRGPTGTLTSGAFTPTGTRQIGGGGGSSSFEDDIEKEAKKVGIIAGVVVAVVWIVWAVGAGIIYWICRRQSKKRWGEPSQMYQNTSPGPMGPDGSNMGVYAAVPPASPMTPNEKVYNPSDPSTFPQTPQSLSYQPSVPAQPSTPTSPTQYSTTGYQPSFQQQQQPYPVATPDRNTAVTPPGAAPQMMNPYEAHYQPQPQQAVAMPMVSYDHTGNSSQLAPNRQSMQQPEQHRQAFMSGVPQV